MATLPVNVDLAAYRGDTWAQTFRFLAGGTPVDLTGATVRSQARRYDGTTVELPCSLGDPGEVTLGLPSDDPNLCGSWTYDVEVTDADLAVTTWVRGQLTVTDDITRPEVATRERITA